MQFLGLASVAAVLAIAGVSAASTMRNQRTSETTSGGSVSPEPRPAATRPSAPQEAATNPAVVLQSTPAVTPPDTSAPAQPAVEASAPPAPVTTPAPRSGFVIVEGRTQLSDSVFAVRTGDSVVVNFDAYGYRTRRSTKLESSLRETLPMVFGKMATASIDTLTPGAFVANRDVVGQLARDGMRVKLDNGAIAHIRVLTRIVSDGPIAIGYLATIER